MPNIPDYSMGELGTLVCLALSAFIALVFLRNNPRLFTAMALFVCSWTLVLGSYMHPNERALADLTSDLAAFLDVYVGVLLLLEVSGTRNESSGHEFLWVQTFALTLLLFLVFP